ncbi:MAG: TIGR00730 family Rossman fold protein [Acidimicrobiales bacterium]
MDIRSPRHRTVDPEIDLLVTELLAKAGAADGPDRDQLYEILATAVGLAGDGTDRLNLKITNAALAEMREAFRVFAPYRDIPKVTIFGSARTQPDDPLYLQTRALATALATAGWMIVTGAGPGIMAAGAEGAGRARSIGVNIRLPFEQEANPFIASDPKLVVMKYFFTRKLMLMKESAGFAVLPGGFGTLDEAFELLTLLQTGKAAPAPIVLLEVPGGTYWKGWDHFIRTEVAARGLVSAEDLALCRITDDVDDAAGELLGFFRNYHSIRFVGNRLVIRLRAAPTTEELAALDRDFADICTRGHIEAVEPLASEVSSRDQLELPRIALHFDRMSYGRLRSLIDALNSLPSAPPIQAPDPDAATAAAAPTEAATVDPIAGP